MTAWRRRLNWTNTLFLVGIHAAAIGGTPAYLSLHGVTPAALGVAALFLAATGISVTGGYHRLFAHGTYEASWPLRLFYLVFGAAAFENSVLKWASDHRRHHRSVDTDLDPYSIRKGFLFAHMGWIFLKDRAEDRIEHVGDLERDPLVRWQHRGYLPIAVSVGFLGPLGLGALLGDPWGGLVLGGFLRVVLLYHSTFCVNSLAHTLGRQPYSDADSSRDHLLTAVVTLGEGYHNFHHTFPFDYRNGVRAHQIDPTKWAIRSLAWVGLTRNLQRVPAEAILKARLRMDHARAARRVSAPEHHALLLAARQRLESLVDRWHTLAAECRRRRTEAGDRARAVFTQLRADRKAAKREFRRAYRAWLRGLRAPEMLTAG